MSHRVHIEWDQYIRLVEGYINNVPNVITLQTPKYIMTGVKAERPWEEEGNSYIQDLKKTRKGTTANIEKEEWEEYFKSATATGEEENEEVNTEDNNEEASTNNEEPVN
ncbi:hypothetical protein QE152_g34076 [Popillia japonica]|uniref:Uncharacterized protein n=1 Tax=Popillia japonica TaxID=7064 RepID=A0AAW1IU57_POPJA